MRISKSLLFISSLLIFFSLAISAYGETYQYMSQWGDQRPALSTQLHKPRGVAVDNSGNVYVSDVGDNKVVKYDSNGNILKTIGTNFNYPMEMTVDKNNYLYVADMFNNKVRVYNSLGTWTRDIQGGGLTMPLGVAVDDSLNVYVTDRGNKVVKKFNSSGSLVATWTGFSKPWGVLSYNGYIYVTETQGTYKVKKLSPNGVLVKEWGPVGIGSGQFRIAEGIVAHNNLLYVADGEYGRIHVFDLDGNFVRMIGERGLGNGQLNFSTALAIDKNNGWLYVSDDDNDRVVKFDLNGNYLDQWGCDSSGTTGIRYPTKIAIDDKNDVMYVVDAGKQRIIKMNSAMQKLSSWGSYGTGNGQFIFPMDAAVDSAGNLYVVDATARNVQKFDTSGVFIEKFDFNSVPLLTNALSSKYGLNAIEFDSADNMYIVDVDTKKLYKIDAVGAKVASWAINSYSTGIDIDDSNGFIYVTTFFPNSAIQYNYLDGQATGLSIGPAVAGTFNMSHSYDVTVDSNRDLFIADTFNSRILKVNRYGGLLWTQGGTAPSITSGYFAYPYGVATDKHGYLYVADTNNHRIQKFRPDFLDLEVTVVPSGGGTVTATGINCPGDCWQRYNSTSMTAQLTATPKTGYHLVNWSEDGSGTANPFSISLFPYTRVTANFVVNSYTISTSVPGGHGTVACTSPVTHGAASICTITPDAHYHLASLTDNGGSVIGAVSGNTYTISNVTAGHTVNGTFALDTYSVTTTVTGGNGSISCASPVSYGGSSTCTITPSTGYHLATLTDNGTSVIGSVSGNTYIAPNVTASRTINASFAINSYNVTATVTGGHGTASCTSPVTHGGSSVCTITADTDYRLATLTDNGASVVGAVSGNSYTIDGVTINHAVNATFELDPNIVASPKALDFLTINAGSTSGRQTVTISNKPSNPSDLEISSISVSGVDSSMFSVSPGTCATLSPSVVPGSSCGIEVKFSPASAGVKSASIRIASNDFAAPNLDIPLTGTGTDLPVFNDVPAGSFAEDFINTVYYNSITAGCGDGNYCPDAEVSRMQMAVFLLKALGEQPAANCTGIFDDVDAQTGGNEVVCKYIEKFSTLGITAGCGSNNFCPNDSVTRMQMAVFITKALNEAPAPACNGDFNDVDANTGGTPAFCQYIEKFATLGITSGCGTGIYCPLNPVSRAQMAVFLTKGFLQ